MLKSSRKSLFKHALRDVFPEVFVEDSNARLAGVSHCIEDSMMQLKSFGAGKYDTVTGRQVIAHLLKNVTAYLDSPNCDQFIMVFDKPTFVPKIKGMEQRRRGESRSKVVPAPDPYPGLVLLPLDEAMPFAWASIMENRKTTRALLAEITAAIERLFHPPAGKSLIIDGGASTDGVAPVEIRSLPVPADADATTFDNARWCVIEGQYLSLLDDERTTPRVVTRPEPLRNAIGEADMAVLFHLLRIAASRTGEPGEMRPASVDVLSGDTDFIPLTLSLHERLAPRNVRVTLSFIGNQGKPLVAKTVLSVHSLAERLKEKLGGVLRYPLECVIAAIISGGNDYVDGYYGIVPSHILNVLLEQAACFGDVVTSGEDGGWLVNPVSYVKFLKALYYDRYTKPQKNKEKPEPDAQPSRKRKRTTTPQPNWQPHGWTILPWEELRSVVRSKNPKRTDFCIPTDATVYLRFQRLSLAFLMMDERFYNTPRAVDDACLRYGYSLIDKDQPISSSNVRFTEDADAESCPSAGFNDALQ